MQTEFVRDKLDELKYDPTFLTGADLDQRIVELERNVAQVVPRRPVGLPDTAAVIVVAVVVCLALIGIQLKITAKAPQPPESAVMPGTSRMTAANIRVLLVLAETIGYVSCLSQGALGFRLATFGFVVLAGLTLLGTRTDRVLKVVAQSIVLSLGLHALFTRVFEVELP